MKQTHASATKNNSAATRNTLLVKSQERGGGHKKQQKSISNIQQSLQIKTSRAAVMIEKNSQVDYTIQINLDSPISNSQENKGGEEQYEKVIEPQLDEKRDQPCSVKSNPTIDARATLLRWQKQDWTPKQIDQYLAVKHVLFKKYKYNIYMIQKSALKIQHFYFKNLAQRQIKEPNSAEAVSVTPHQIDLNSHKQKGQKNQTTSEISINIQAVKKKHNQQQSKLQPQSQQQYQQQQLPPPQVKQEQEQEQQIQQQQQVDIKQKRLKQQILSQDDSCHQKVVQQGSPLKQFYSPRPGEVNTRDKDSAVLNVLKKVMDDRSQQNHSRFSAKFQKSKDKYNHLQSFEEKSFIKLRPSAQAIDALTESKATEIFNSYNREREYMSRKKSNSPIFSDRLTIQTEQGVHNRNVINQITPTVEQNNQQQHTERYNNENLKNINKSKNDCDNNYKVKVDQNNKQALSFDSVTLENDIQQSPQIKINISSDNISNCSPQYKIEISLTQQDCKHINSTIISNENMHQTKEKDEIAVQRQTKQQMFQIHQEQTIKEERYGIIQNQQFKQLPMSSSNEPSDQKLSDFIQKSCSDSGVIISSLEGKTATQNQSIINKVNNQQYHDPTSIKNNTIVKQDNQNRIITKSKSQSASKFNPVRSQKISSQPTGLQSYMMQRLNGSNSSSSLMEPLLSTKNEKKFSNSRLNDTTCTTIKNNTTTTVQQQNSQLAQNCSSKDLNYPFDKCQVMDRKSLTAQKQAPFKALEQVQSPIVIPSQNSLQSSSHKKALVQYTPIKEKIKSNNEIIVPRESPPQPIKQQQDIQQNKLGYSSKLQKDKQFQNKQQSQEKQQTKGTVNAEQKIKTIQQQPNNQTHLNNQQIVNSNLTSSSQKIDKQALLLDILEKGRLLEQKESQLKSQMSQRSVGGSGETGEYKILKLQNPKSKLNSIKDQPSKQKVYQQLQLPTNNSYQLNNPSIATNNEQRQIITSDRSSLPNFENKTPITHITQISQRSLIVDKRNSQQHHNLAMTQLPSTLQSMAEKTDKLLVSSFDSSQNKTIGKQHQAAGSSSKNYTNDKERYLKSLKKQYGLQRKKSTDSLFSRATIENTQQHTSAVGGAQFDTKSVHSRGFSQVLVFEKLSNDYQSRISGFNYNNGMSSSLHRSTESVNQKRRDKHTFDHDERDVRVQTTTASRIIQNAQKDFLSERNNAI